MNGFQTTCHRFQRFGRCDRSKQHAVARVGGATDADWRAAIEQAVDVTDVRGWVAVTSRKW